MSDRIDQTPNKPTDMIQHSPDFLRELGIGVSPRPQLSPTGDITSSSAALSQHRSNGDISGSMPHRLVYDLEHAVAAVPSGIGEAVSAIERGFTNLMQDRTATQSLKDVLPPLTLDGPGHH